MIKDEFIESVHELKDNLSSHMGYYKHSMAPLFFGPLNYELVNLELLLSGEVGLQKETTGSLECIWKYRYNPVEVPILDGSCIDLMWVGVLETEVGYSIRDTAAMLEVFAARKNQELERWL